MSRLLVMPSIDIKDGKTVRIVKGIPELGCDDYGDDPVEMAMIWRAENAKCIHVVDFDDALNYSHKNFDLIEDMCNSVVIPVEVGGGINSYEDAKILLGLGVFRVVIGTMTHNNPKEFAKIVEDVGPKKVAAALDVVDGYLAIKGRRSVTNIPAIEHALKLKEYGVERIIVTDVNKNGTLSGPNLELSKSVADATGVKVTHSGGVGGFKDLMKVTEYQKDNIDSVIVGRALYENRFSCQKIWRVAESGIFN